MKNYIDTFIDEMSEFSAEGYEGQARLPFTEESVRAYRYIIEKMRDLGLEVHCDRYGTIQGHMEGRDPGSLIIGSHYDTVYNGGRFDGVAGIACGLAVVKYFKDKGFLPEKSIDVLAFNDEEGVRFTQGFMSSKVIAGIYPLSESFDKQTGQPLDELASMGMYGDEEISLKTSLKNAEGYIEVHIEQGAILENEGRELGLVTNINGIERFFVNVGGSCGHSGTTPMSYRSDALIAACQLILELQGIPGKYKDSVLTTGFMSVSPNAINTISDSVRFSVDARSPRAEDLAGMRQDIIDICRPKSLMFTKDNSVVLEHATKVPALPLDNSMTLAVEQAMKDTGVNYMPINSGAGHDSQIFAELTPTSMIFVPSRGGHSHRPDEFTDSRYIVQAVQVIAALLEK